MGTAIYIPNADFRNSGLGKSVLIDTVPLTSFGLIFSKTSYAGTEVEIPVLDWNPINANLSEKEISSWEIKLSSSEIWENSITDVANINSTGKITISPACNTEKTISIRATTVNNVVSSISEITIIYFSSAASLINEYITAIGATAAETVAFNTFADTLNNVGIWNKIGAFFPNYKSTDFSKLDIKTGSSLRSYSAQSYDADKKAMFIDGDYHEEISSLAVTSMTYGLFLDGSFSTTINRCVLGEYQPFNTVKFANIGLDSGYPAMFASNAATNKHTSRVAFCVLNNIANALTIYYDGVLKGSGTGNANNKLYLNGVAFTTTGYTDFWASMIFFSNQNLTEQEIQALSTAVNNLRNTLQNL